MTHDRTTHNRRRAIIFLSVLLSVFLAVAYVMGRPYLPMLAYSVVLATVFHPLQRLLLRRTHSPNVAALISTSVVCLLIAVPVMIVLNLAAWQALEVAREIEAKSASEGGLVPFLTRQMDLAVLSLGKHVDLSGLDVRAQLQAKAKAIGAVLLPAAGARLANLPGSILNLFLGLITVYYLLRDGDRMVGYFLRLLPLTDEHAKRLVQTLKDSIVANVQGVIAVGAAQGLTTGLALAVLGVSNATLLGMLAAFCSVIPLIGTSLVWIPAAILLIATGHLVKGLILLGLGAGVVSQMDSVVRPLFVGKKVQANALVVMISMLGGVRAFGFLGLFIGPIIVALIIAVSKMLREEIAKVPVV
jgi:predicted PurR-regulated permease PerM